MTQLTHDPAYLLIEDRLDAIGQKYRAIRIARGAILWLAFAAIASVAAAVVAYVAGPGRVAGATLIVWGAWAAASAIYWIGRPLLLRPGSVEVARFVEMRIDGLHNGLTNSVLLAGARDLSSSPWLAQIYREILDTVEGRDLGRAVGARDLKAVATILLCVAMVGALLMGVPRTRGILLHGWRQMAAPHAFVPKVGRVRIIEVTPASITLVSGQPLEITLRAEDPDAANPSAKVVFEPASAVAGASQGEAEMNLAPAMPSESADKELRFTYRLEHVEAAMRFRVEVGGTQSPWCDVRVVRQVKLQRLDLTITPPPYTKKPPQSLALKSDEVEKTPIAVLEGSKIDIEVQVDVAVGTGLLAVDSESPRPMERAAGGTRFGASLVVTHDVNVAALLAEGAGQVVGKVPENGLLIRCTRDSAPTVEMKWPTQDLPVPLDAELKIRAMLKDEVGLTKGRVLMSTSEDLPLIAVHEQPFADGTTASEIAMTLSVPPEFRRHGAMVRVQVEAVDNRSIVLPASKGSTAPTSVLGPQTTSSPVFRITFRDERQIARENKEQLDRLRALLMEMLQKQRALHDRTVAWKPAESPAMLVIGKGQDELRKMMQLTADTFPFTADDKLVQKTLLVLVAGPAKDAVDLATATASEPVEKEKLKAWRDVQSKQRRIIDMLESLLSRLADKTPATTQQTKSGADLENEKEKFKELDEALKKFIKEEQRIMEATATLAKKPVDNWDDADKKLLEELKQSQEKLDAFMQEKVSDFSKLAEQDMANASLLKELMEVYSEVTMAKDALKKKATEIAVPLEESGLELAKEISSNLEKWLMDKPDREAWKMEDPLTKTDTPMAELPKELEDMIGELMEQQEDLMEEAEDTNQNWADSLDKGAGWDAADGPIASMTAKGVTGNQLPNNNEMGGRSGEGRSGKSQGEMVEETASGKGGRPTPTRLDPTPFQQGQVKDESKDPVGGATGGGKLSGQGGQGLEGPVPPKDLTEKMERLAGKQAELRNKAERLALDKQVSRYDQFKLLEAAALMRRVESDIHANRYSTAMRRRDVLLDRMEESKLLLSGQIHTQRDTTPAGNKRVEDEVNDVNNGQLPAAWSEALKEYYRKLAQQ